jgi:hypothetical protein
MKSTKLLQQKFKARGRGKKGNINIFQRSYLVGAEDWLDGESEGILKVFFCWCNGGRREEK